MSLRAVPALLFACAAFWALPHSASGVEESDDCRQLRAQTTFRHIAICEMKQQQAAHLLQLSMRNVCTAIKREIEGCAFYPLITQPAPAAPPPHALSTHAPPPATSMPAAAPQRPIEARHPPTRPIEVAPDAQPRDVLASIRLKSDPGEVLPNCDGPDAVGWLAAAAYVGAHGTQTVYDVHFAAQPASRSGRPDQLPGVGEVLTFSPRYPAPVYSASIACVTDECRTAPVAGQFTILRRIHYSGLNGATYWQLCIGRAKGGKDI
ncbi:MAG: hypothetical protein WDM91_14205 [Rhizomicrobium sp.]